MLFCYVHAKGDGTAIQLLNVHTCGALILFVTRTYLAVSPMLPKLFKPVLNDQLELCIGGNFADTLHMKLPGGAVCSRTTNYIRIELVHHECILAVFFPLNEKY